MLAVNAVLFTSFCETSKNSYNQTNNTKKRWKNGREKNRPPNVGPSRDHPSPVCVCVCANTINAFIGTRTSIFFRSACFLYYIKRYYFRRSFNNRIVQRTYNRSGQCRLYMYIQNRPGFTIVYLIYYLWKTIYITLSLCDSTRCFFVCGFVCA